MFAERAFSVILRFRVCFFLVFICTKVLFRKRPRACHCTGRHRSLPSSVYFQSGIQTWRGHKYDIKKHNHHSKQRTQRHGSTKHCGSITTTLRTKNPILQRGKKTRSTRGPGATQDPLHGPVDCLDLTSVVGRLRYPGDPTMCCSHAGQSGQGSFFPLRNVSFDSDRFNTT